MKNKLLGLLLSITLVATSLTGCGSNGDDSREDSRSSESTQEETVSGQEQSGSSEGSGQDEESQGTDGEADGEVIELTFWAWWSSEARKPHILEMVEGFNNSQSKYHVNYVDIG